jgi:hypothetical protein
MSTTRLRSAALGTSLLLGAACSTGGGATGSDGGTDGRSATDAAKVDGSHGGTSSTRGSGSSRTGTGSGSGTSGTGSGSGSGSASASGPTFGGCPLFSPTYAYNQDVSQLQPDPSSASYIASLKSLAPAIAAEFPGGEYYNTVRSTQANVLVQTAAAYGFLPDGGFFYDTAGALASVTAPIPAGVVYENMTTPNSDHHMMVLEQGSCVLYELYAENPSSATTGWDVMVEWNLRGSPQIPGSYDTGSTTQAGTPLLPGIIWPVDVAAGEIDHAIDIVLASAAIMPCAYVPPASTVRYSGAPAGQGIPYGARLRLKSTFDSSSLTGTQAKVVVRALQKFGMIPTDASGEARNVFRLGQSPDGGTLDQTDMSQLNALTWDDFDVMPLGTIINPTGCTP